MRAHRRWARGGAVGTGLAFVALTSGCELAEVTLAEPPVDVVVVEALVQLGVPAADAPMPSQDRIAVFLHRTVVGADGQNDPVPGALVQVVGPGGALYRLRELVEPSPCLVSTPLEGTGTCYLLEGELLDDASPLSPGDRLELEISTLEGELLTATSVIPGRFNLVGLRDGGACVLRPSRPYPMVWTASEGAWAYVAETEMYGLRAALEPRGIEVEIDPLFLVGLAVSASDTTITFPSEFGVFERFDLDRDFALALQEGMPAGTAARVSISSVDRNYVNWVRGGNFNPSGSVRIPSVRGDGTGFFGTSVTRWVDFLVNPAPDGGFYTIPRCPEDGVIRP